MTVVHHIHKTFDELTSVLNRRKPAEISLDDQSQKLNDLIRELDEDNTKLNDKTSDKLMDILTHTYLLVHGKYKNYKFFQTNGDEKRNILDVNQTLNIFCEAATRLYSIFGSNRPQTPADLILIILECHMKLNFEDKKTFTQHSLPIFNRFIRRFGGEQSYAEFKKTAAKYEEASFLQYASSSDAKSSDDEGETAESVANESLNSERKELEMTTKLVTELVKILNTKREKDRRTECGLCHKTSFIAYTYHCLMCDKLKICSSCFENRKFSEQHAITHPVVRYDEDFDGNLFGVHFESEDDLTLNRLEVVFAKEKHHNIKCETCGVEPITGLRFKCDLCYDYNLCRTCFGEKRSSRLHSSKHPVITIGKTESLVIDKREVQLLGQPLGRGAFGTVFRANYLRQNKIVACKIIRCDSLTKMLGMNPSVLVNSFIRELTAFREVKVID